MADLDNSSSGAAAPRTELRLDLNADLGEGFGRWSLGPDEELLDLITSANVACGFHAGDPTIIRRVCARAASSGVRIGAQVSYRDLAGFGRREMSLPPDELRDEVLYQLAALEGISRVEGTSVSYVKPHGALYNRCFRDREQAEAVIEAVVDFRPDLTVLGQAGSALLAAAADAGLAVAHEVFADRAYAPDGSLVPRTEPGAVIHDSSTVIERVVGMATSGTVVAADGSRVGLRVDSVCLHSDTPGAAQLATRLRDTLRRRGVDVAAFT